MILLILIILFLLYFIIFKAYKQKIDTLIAYTGGLGSGKTFMSVQTALKLLRKQRFKTWWHNLTKKDKWERPLLYSNIPIRINKKEWSCVLTKEHLLLTSKLPLRCVCLIDEVSLFCSQFDYKNINIITNVNEFFELFRHYTNGGYLIVNDQCSANINLWIRRRLNSVFNLSTFRMYLKLIYKVDCRKVNIIEDNIQTNINNDYDENIRTIYGLVPAMKYDTYCYSERYKSVPILDDKKHKRFKLNKLLKCPQEKIKPLTSDIDED